MREPLIVDMFAGGGGASVGIEMALGRYVDIAINHDEQAIAMHKVNHPNTIHLTEDIFKVNLKEIVKGQHVGLMWASLDCNQGGAVILVKKPNVINSSGDGIAGTLDSHYWKGCGERQGAEREFVAVKKRGGDELPKDNGTSDGE